MFSVSDEALCLGVSMSETDFLSVCLSESLRVGDVCVCECECL